MNVITVEQRSGIQLNLTPANVGMDTKESFVKKVSVKNFSSYFKKNFPKVFFLMHPVAYLNLAMPFLFISLLHYNWQRYYKLNKLRF